MLDNKVILITGGTGSFGKRLAKRILAEYTPKKLIIFSRDELKQFEMQYEFPNTDCMRYFLGDIRDRDRLMTAFNNVDVVFHAAAMKQVEASEYNPFEAVKTNIIGAENVIRAAIEKKVERVIALSTDKACSPVNLYGATKLCGEKLFMAGNYYVGEGPTRFSVVRYGNVIGSRGSVVPFFFKQREEGVLTITDPRMTRFWITLDEAVSFVLAAYRDTKGGEIFVPKLPTTLITDLATAIGPDCEQKIIGIRPGEKLHEAMIMADEARDAIEQETRYIIQPKNSFRTFDRHEGSPVEEGFQYASDNQQHVLSIDDIKAKVAEWQAQHVYA